MAWSAVGGKGQCREKVEEEGERGRKEERKEHVKTISDLQAQIL